MLLNLIERVYKKIVLSGDTLELYEYDEGYLKGYELTDSEKGQAGRLKDEKSENYEEHRKQVLQRAKKNLRRLINANHGQYGDQFTSKFLTLTFKENIQDIKQANYEFKKFMQRLNYYCFGTKKANLKYTTVVEFQKRGAIHYHTIIYNMPYTKQKVIEETWGNGWIFINKIDDVDNVGAYVSAYLGNVDKGQGKDVFDDRLQGKKSYFSSRGLYKPIEITDKKIVETVAAALPNEELTYTATFANDHLGNITYKQYNIKRLKQQRV